MRYDAVIVGAGQAAPGLASDLTKRGWKVALCEGAHFGGSCVNYGCTPSKTLLGSAHTIHMARQGAEFGFHTGEVTVDFPRVMERQRAMVNNHRQGLEEKFSTMNGLTVYRAYAQFESAKRLRVGDAVIEADRVYLDVGSVDVVPKIEGLDSVSTLNYISLLELDALPEHLIILGGGYLGVEYGQAFRRFGSRVTIIEKGEQLLDREDGDIARAIQEVLEGEGVRILLGAELKCVEGRDGGIYGEVLVNGVKETVSGSHLLLAVGRKPNTERLNLDKTGVAMDDKGAITVDDHLRTNVEGIYALGDVTGHPAFTHTAYDDYLIIADNLNGGSRNLKGRINAYAVYSDPPLGRVGMNEGEARASGRRVLMATLPMSEVDRALQYGQPHGLMKVLVDADSERVLGVSVLGLSGDEVAQGFLHLMYADAPYTVMANAMYVHPTMTEMLPTILAKLEPLR